MLSRSSLWIVQHRESGEAGLLVTLPTGNYGFVKNGTYLSTTKAGQVREYSIAEIIVLFRPGNRAASRLLKASLDLLWGPTFTNDSLPETETGVILWQTSV